MLAAHIFQTACILRARHLGYIEGQLKDLPNTHLGKRKRNGQDIRVIRTYNYSSGKLVRKQFDFDSPRGVELLKQMEKRRSLETRKDNLTWSACLEKGGFGIIRDDEINIPARFSKEAFDRLIEKNDQSIGREFCYDGHRFRSKSEVNMAQFLKSMGLEYKYEVKIIIDKQIFYIDFAVYCPETGRFFFIEHFGMMGNERYRMGVFNKLTAYSTCGLQEGRDILYTYENAEDGYNIDIIQGKIVGVIATQMAMAKRII